MSEQRVERRSRDAHIWERDRHDWYLEPQWCSERLFQAENFEGDVWDPACGSGRIVHAAMMAGYDAAGSDIVDRVPEHNCFSVSDFFESCGRVDNIVSNPPFGVADRFVAHALAVTERKVAMLLPLTWLAGAKRGKWLATTPLIRVWILCPRPSMPPGAAIAAGVMVGGGTKDFAFCVWDCAWKVYQAPEIRWLHREAVAT